MVESRHRCEFCGKEIWPGERDYEEVIGWVKIRTKGGGVNAVSEMKKTGRFMHELCWKERQLDGQASLL